jgi:hypothetical protein
LPFEVDDIEVAVQDLTGKGVEFLDYAEGPFATAGRIAQLGPARAAWSATPTATPSGSGREFDPFARHPVVRFPSTRKAADAEVGMAVGVGRAGVPGREGAAVAASAWRVWHMLTDTQVQVLSAINDHCEIHRQMQLDHLPISWRI